MECEVRPRDTEVDDGTTTAQQGDDCVGRRGHQVSSLQFTLTYSLLRRPSKTAQPLVHADRPKLPSKLTVRGPFVYRDQILLLH